MGDNAIGVSFVEIFAALGRPFQNWEVKIKPAQGGRQLRYVTARTVMNRLDEEVGPLNWWDDYVPGENSVVCKLSIRFEDGSIVTKQDAGGYAGMSDQGDDDKSGFSDAFKRAAAKWGVGRYLYNDGVPSFVSDTYPDTERTPEPPPQGQQNGTGYQAPPVRRDIPQDNPGGYQQGPNGYHQAPPHQAPPHQAPQQQAPQQQRQQAPQQGNQGGNGGGGGNDQRGQNPRTGKALFAWTKDMEQQHEVGLLKYINGWAKLQEFPSRMIDWSPEQVQLGHQEAVRKLASIQPQRGGYQEEAMAN